MLAEMRQIKAEGRRKVVELWSHHVPDFIEQPAGGTQGDDSPVSFMAADEFGDRSSLHSDDMISAPSGSQSSSMRLSNEVRNPIKARRKDLSLLGHPFR